MPSKLSLSCYLRNFIFQVKLAWACLRRIVYSYPEGSALINHAMFLAKALCFRLCLTELDTRLFLCSGLSSVQREVTRLLDSCFSPLLPSILNTTLHALSFLLVLATAPRSQAKGKLGGPKNKVLKCKS